jgi:hypothetical protein
MRASGVVLVRFLAYLHGRHIRVSRCARRKEGARDALGEARSLGVRF